MTHSYRVATLAILAVAVGAAVAAAAERYRVYANARFGTTAEVPADWIADPPPENGDGIRFRSPDGRASITVSGSLNLDDSVDAGMELRARPDQGETITYSHRDGKSLVVSGTRGEVIFYARYILSCRDQIWNDLWIEYPASQKTAYDALVTHVSRSLHSGRSGWVPKC